MVGKDKISFDSDVVYETPSEKKEDVGRINLIELIDEPLEQIVFLVGLLAGWKKAKPDKFPGDLSQNYKHLYTRYQLGFYISRVIQGAAVIIIAKLGGFVA